MPALPLKETSHMRTLQCVLVMSALPPKADIGTQPRNVRVVPKADIRWRDWDVCSKPKPVISQRYPVGGMSIMSHSEKLLGTHTMLSPCLAPNSSLRR